MTPFAEELKKNVAVQVPFPVSRSHFEKAVASFFQFLSLPESLKNKFKARISDNDRGSFVGYARRNADSIAEYGETKDNKEYFHYHPLAEEFFKDILSEGDPVVMEFFANARVLFREAEKAMEECIKKLDQDFPGLYKSFAFQSPNRRFALRFLKYDSHEKGIFLAKGHYDRGVSTLALAESAPGLRIGKDDKTLAEVVHKENFALFMPALHFPRLTSPEFSPAWHDVVQKDGQRLGEGVARWAVVFFADALDTPIATFEEAHTPHKV